MSILKAVNLTRRFGGLAAVSHVNLDIKQGELVGLIGPNGAGKTTLFNLFTGVYEPSEGSVELQIDGKMRNIGGLKPYKITSLGLARTFQNIRLFKELSALDNVKIAMHTHVQSSILTSIFRKKDFFEEERELERRAHDILNVVGLDHKANEFAKNLPYGEQRRLEIARALATRPAVLFLDEPAAGMNPQETAELTDLIANIKQEFHLTIVLIEHDMSLVMKVCERIFVLDYGELIASGTPEQIKANPRVIEAYLGEEA